MIDDTGNAAPERAPARDAGVLLLAAGGLAAAFGAASCCTLPVLLGSLGLGSVWLASLAWLAAPHQPALLTAAVACLAGAAGVFLWRRHAAARAPSAACRRPWIAVLVSGVLSLGAVLVVLG